MSNENEKDSIEKRKRVRLTGEKTLYLQRYFEVKPRPSTAEKREIAKCLSMNFRSVQVWFQNRRAKHKKDIQDMGPNLNIQYESNFDFRNYATNNSLFTPREALYSKEIDFYDEELTRPKRMYKFHDCTVDLDKGGDFYDDREFWYDSYVNYEDSHKRFSRN